MRLVKYKDQAKRTFLASLKTTIILLILKKSSMKSQTKVLYLDLLNHILNYRAKKWKRLIELNLVKGFIKSKEAN